jgi:microcystin-dependent protein
MTTPFLGEIRLFAGTFAPVGWLMCDGSLQPISSNETLYSLLGTTFGGNGTATFGLPDLRGRVPIHQGSVPSVGTYVIGQSGGAEVVSLTPANLPAHNHTLAVSTAAGTVADPTNALLAVADPACKVYVANKGTVPLNAAQVMPSTSPGSPHNNMQPYIAMNYIIATAGIFPSQG